MSATKVLKELRRRGLLLFSDSHRPSVTTLVAGTPIEGSWWGHPAGGIIYAVGEVLEDQHRILSEKLVDGKITLIDDRLVPAVLRVGAEGANWQVDKLGPSALALLKYVERVGVARADRLATESGPGSSTIKNALRILGARLLVHSESIHTETGAHTLQIESWRHLGSRRGVKPTSRLVDAERMLEDAARGLDPARPSPYGLPWK